MLMNTDQVVSIHSPIGNARSMPAAESEAATAPSQSRRWVLCLIATIHIVSCSGAAYGWTALRPLLVAENYAGSKQNSHGLSLLTEIGSLGIIANALVKYPVGFLLDHGGPRITSVTGGLTLLCGCLLMGLEQYRTNAKALFLGYFLIGAAGPLVQMPTFQFAELFGVSGRSHAIAFFVVCFELSTGVFWVMSKMCSLGVRISTLFLGYALVGGFVALTAALFFPDIPCSTDSSMRSENSQHSNGLERTDQNNLEHEHIAAVTGSPMISARLYRKQPSKSIWSYLATFEFLYAATFLSVHIFRHGFMMASVGPQAESKFRLDRPDVTQTLPDDFSFILPLGFLPMLVMTVLGVPGALATNPLRGLAIVNVLSCPYNLLLLEDSPVAWRAAFVLFPICRQLVFSSFFSYLVGAFGHDVFGRLSGIASSLAGILQLVQVPLLRRLESQIDWAPWAVSNLILGILPLLLVLPTLPSLQSHAKGRLQNRKELLRKRRSDTTHLLKEEVYGSTSDPRVSYETLHDHDTTSDAKLPKSHSQPAFCY